MEFHRQNGGYTLGTNETIRIKTVPHQRTIQVNKAPTDKTHLYTSNNLAAIDEAAARLQSFGGFKLYIYLAKNQNKYTFALSSKAFFDWCGLGIQAYRTAFKELEDQGYLIPDKEQKNLYAFYDKSLKQEKEEKRNIDIVDIKYSAPAPTDDFKY